MSGTIDILFKGGQTVTLKVDKFVVKTGTAENDLRGMEWTLLDTKAARPLFINLSEVAAVIERESK